jgi:hypothetical protein
VIPTLLDQLTACTPIVAQGKRADFGSRKQGSAADRILELMTDGAVWDSTKLIEQLDLDRSTVNGALRHLVQRSMISHVGADHETPRGKKLYRIKARTC